MQTCKKCGTANRINARFCSTCGNLMSPATSGQTGLLLANSLLQERYLILKKVGQGGMAAVYQAQDTRLGGMVAIKEMSSAHLTDSVERQKAVSAFLHEGQLLASLVHPNLPRVTDSFEENGKQFLVMDFVEGQSLEQIAAASAGCLPESQVIGWIDQLCDVLEYLHTHHPPVIFRDLKPANIMLTPDGKIKLIDFGIARLFKAGQTKDTTPFGTMGFAAPEQFGTGQTDARSDVYSLGVTLYVLLTKYDPAQSPFNLPPARMLNPQISPQTETVIMRATLSSPDQRFQSASEFKQALHPATDVHAVPFTFRTGEQARNVNELVRLCENRPADAVWHLESGHFEPWFIALGQPAFAQAATLARQSAGIGTERLKQFVTLTGVPSKLTGSTTTPGGKQYSREFVFEEARAGGLRRFFGLGIDFAIMLTVMAFAASLLTSAAIAQVNAAVIFFGIALFLYFVLAWMIAGQTPGQMIVGIRVVRQDGTLPGFWTATGRWFVMAITVALCWSILLYLLLAYLWNRFRKPPHDRAANTEGIRIRFMAKQYPGYDIALTGRQYVGVFLAALICLFVLPLTAAGIAGLGSVRVAAVPTPAPTAAPPTPVPTRVAVAPTTVPTATPSYDAIVEGTVNLYTGPAISFSAVATLVGGTPLRVIGREGGASDWVYVESASGQRGWVRAGLVKLNVALTAFPLTQVPPTYTPNVTPTRTLTPTPKVCPPNPVLVQINNFLNTSLSLRLSGPNTAANIYIPQNSYVRLCLAPGMYSYTMSASGYMDDTGTENLTQGPNTACKYWYWKPITMIDPIGTCSENASLYSPP